jgi:uncharacterized protein YndB with AHSA1/START domain
MPVLDVEKDLDRNTLTVTAEFAAPVERVWELYADPRQLERHWGPPGWPATFVEVDDAFADERGVPDEAMGWIRMAATFAPAEGGTRVVFVTTYRSTEQLQQMLDMGMEEGLKQAMGQIDGILAEDAAAV